MSPDKKLQQKGYDRHPFKEIRNKLREFFDTEDVTPYVSLKRKKRCRGNKQHIYIKVKDGKGWIYEWTDFQCDICGKRKTEFKKGILV